MIRDEFSGSFELNRDNLYRWLNLNTDEGEDDLAYLICVWLGAPEFPIIEVNWELEITQDMMEYLGCVYERVFYKLRELPVERLVNAALQVGERAVKCNKKGEILP